MGKRGHLQGIYDILALAGNLRQVAQENAALLQQLSTLFDCQPHYSKYLLPKASPGPVQLRLTQALDKTEPCQCVAAVATMVGSHTTQTRVPKR